jgi:hypothetical protein
LSTAPGGSPPLTRPREDKPEWAELIRLRAKSEVRRLVDRLNAVGIETRLRLAAGGAHLRTVLVRRTELEDARFVVLQISFEGPSTAERRGSMHPLLVWVAVVLTTIALVVALFAHPAGSSGGEPAIRCRPGALWAAHCG